jgi:hypothetical protein
MKLFIVSSLLVLLSLSLNAGTFEQSALVECKDSRGLTVSGTIEALKKVMNAKSNRPQVAITGVVSQILPEDRNGRPHQKYIIAVDSKINLQIVSNLEFGKAPVLVGKSVTICGEFLRVGQGMIHWTHFDPHGGHADGFTIVDGKVYGDKEIPGFN